MTSTAVSRMGDARRNAMRGAFFGFFIDMFDIYLPVVVLAPATDYFVSPALSPSAKSLVSSVIFAATLVGRPIGALIFGHYADRLGRKRATVISICGFGVLTVVIAALPGYKQWGAAGVALFVALRFLVGIFVGGEYTAGSPLAMEYSPKERRGVNGALIITGFPLAFVVISLLTLAMLHIAPAGTIDSPYVQWGWRIPFLFGGALAFVAVRYFTRHVEESDIFARSGGTKAPLKELFQGSGLRDFGQVFVLMTGFWLTLNTVSAILPGMLTSESFGLSGTRTTFVLIVAFAVVPIGYLAAGAVSQRIGRRRFLIAWGIVVATLGTFVYYLLLSSAQAGFVAVVALTIITVPLVISHWGLAIAYVTERFRTGVRASGFGLGYSLAVVIPAFYAFYQGELSAIMRGTYTVLPLVAIGGLLITAGAALGPETKDVDFAAAGQPAPARRESHERARQSQRGVTEIS